MQKPSIGPSQAAKERATIEFELYALQRCAHKHVVELLGAADVAGDTYIAMERCEGDLTAFLTPPRQLSERAVATMMRQVRGARALTAALHCAAQPHTNPVVRSSRRRSRTYTSRESFT